MTFLKYILATLSSRGVILVCGFLSGMVSARWLGPHDRGILALVTSIPATVWMLASFGINQGNVFYLGKKKYPLADFVTSSFILPLGIGVSISLLLWTTKDFFILKYINGFNREYLLFALIPIPIIMIKNSCMGILRGLEKFYFIATSSGVIALLSLFFSVTILLGLKEGLFLFLVGVVTIKVLEFVWTMYEVLKIAPLSLSINLDLTKDVYRFGVKSYIQNMVGFLHNKIDLYMLAYFLLPAQIAFYDIAVLLGEILLFLPQTISFVILPKLIQEQEQDKVKIVGQTARLTLCLSVFGGVMMLLMGKWFIEFVYGASYLAAFAPLYLLIPGIILSSINSAIIPYYTSRQQQKVVIVTGLISLLANVILNVFFIPLYGIRGAAFSTLITYSLFSIILVVLFKRDSHTTLGEILVPQRSDLISIKNLIFPA